MAFIDVYNVKGVSVIKFSRPEKLNALNLEMWSHIRDILVDECSGDARAIVLTGEGRAFSAGDDIGAMLEASDMVKSMNFFETLRSTVETLSRCPKPVVAAVNGLAVGGGAEMLLLVDYVIASRKAWFSLPESRIGLIPPILLTVGVDILGLRTAKKLAITGDRIDVEDALKLGLVDEIIEGEDLIEKAVETALKLSEITTPEALKAIRELLYARYSTILGDAVKHLAELNLTESARERMKAFIEKKLKP